MSTDPKPRLPRTEEVPLLASEQRTVEQLGGTVLLDRYRLIEPLGSGGGSVVYRAEHTIMQKAMAVKILRPEHAARPDFVRRFLDEARTVARLRHENIVDVVDIGRSESGVVFCVMEWLEGEDLGATIDREGAMQWARAQRIVLQICRALIAAHGAGIVHRDVKPQNCFRIRRGRDRDFIKLLDFGIAKDVGATHRLTVTGAIMGTVGYMAPEQARGEVVDARADVYAVGAILFELLSGRPVFEGEHFLDVMVQQATEPAPRLASVVSDLPDSLDDIVARALAQKREDRFASMTEFAGAIMAIARAPTSASRRDEAIAGDARTVIAPAAGPVLSAASGGEGLTMVAPVPTSPAIVVRPVPVADSWPPPVGPAPVAAAGSLRAVQPLPSGPHALPVRSQPRGGVGLIVVVLVLPVAIGLGIYGIATDGPDATTDVVAQSVEQTAPKPTMPARTAVDPPLAVEAAPTPSALPAPTEPSASDDQHQVERTRDEGAASPAVEQDLPPVIAKSARPTVSRRPKQSDPVPPRGDAPAAAEHHRIEQRIQRRLQEACGDEHAREGYTITLTRLPGAPTMVTVKPSNPMLKDCINKHVGKLDVVADSAAHYRVQLKPRGGR